MSSFNSGVGVGGSNLDHLFLQTLISRLQLRQPTPPLPRSLDDLLLDAFSNLSSSSSDDDNNPAEDRGNHKTQFAKEESRLEKQLIRLIRSGETETLKPNSGQAVGIGEHHICVGYNVEDGSDYRVWEWHGHMMMFDEEYGYTPEYIYGNYFERLPAKSKGKKEEVKVTREVQEDEDKPVNLGLKALIDGVESGRGRVVHRGSNPTW